MNYETLLDEAHSNGIYVIENAPFESKAKGLIKDDVIGLNKTIDTSTERACILAEELGHYYTTTGNIIDQTDTFNRKQERTARIWAYNKLIGLHGIIDACNNKCNNKYDMAEYLGVTVDFLDEAIETYSQKYGICTVVDNYVIYFTPTLRVMEYIPINTKELLR